MVVVRRLKWLVTVVAFGVGHRLLWGFLEGDVRIMVSNGIVVSVVRI